MRDLTRSEQQALYAASHDKLTGLPNRTGLIEALEALRDGQADWHYAIAFFDLDGFKEVNDAYGHATGDELLRLVADGFKAISAGRICWPASAAMNSRLSVTGTDPEKEAAELARSLHPLSRRAIRHRRTDHHRRHQRRHRRRGPTGRPRAEELFRRADVAMFEAKKQGPNRLDIYRAAIDTIRHERLAIADDLRRALQAESLTVEYQPIFDARTGRIVAAEALLRWFRPGHGDISPEVFIPIAEESGLIEELGTWVLRRATRDAAAWPEVRLAVNASPAQFRSPGFPLIVANLIAETGFPVRQLEIEMTESYFVSHPEQARSAIDALRRLGVNVALDDFGAGYASIGYLRDFDFGKIKLDRTMIAGITTDVRAQRLVHATISLADALDMTVTVEGVASDEEVALLRLAGARELQGFFLARPQTAEAFAALLDRRLADLPSGRWAKAG